MQHLHLQNNLSVGMLNQSNLHVVTAQSSPAPPQFVGVCSWREISPSRASVASQAELEESRVVHDAVAAAPDLLRSMGLAFRVHVVAASTAPDSPAVKLAAALAPRHVVLPYPHSSI